MYYVLFIQHAYCRTLAMKAAMVVSTVHIAVCSVFDQLKANPYFGDHLVQK